MRDLPAWGSIFNYEEAAKIKATPPSCNEKNPLKIRLLFGGKMWYVFIYQTRAHAQKKINKKTQYTLYFHGRYMAFFFTLSTYFFIKKSGTYVKKHVHI